MLGPDEDGAEAYQRYLDALPCPRCAAMKGKMTVEGIAKEMKTCAMNSGHDFYRDDLLTKIARAVIAYLEDAP